MGELSIQPEYLITSSNTSMATTTWSEHLSLPQISLLKFCQKVGIGNGLCAYNNPVNAGINQFFNFINTADTAAILHLHIGFSDHIKQILLVAEIVFCAVKVDDVDKIGAVRLVFFDHFFQRNIIFCYLLDNRPRAASPLFYLKYLLQE